jgi:hypothetical protein
MGRHDFARGDGTQIKLMGAEPNKSIRPNPSHLFNQCSMLAGRNRTLIMRMLQISFTDLITIALE